MKVKHQGVTEAAFNATPRLWRETVIGCEVEECPRSHAALGLCRTHFSAYDKRRKRLGQASYSVADWIRDEGPQPLSQVQRCAAAACGLDRAHVTDLCGGHHRRYLRWRQANTSAGNDLSVDLWLAREVEPPMDPVTLDSYAATCVTPFGLLPGPARWEYLVAVQRRDMAGRANLDAVSVRSTYLGLRRSGVTSLVGLDLLGLPPLNRERHAMLNEYQRIIDDAYRAWTGVDNRDPRVLYLHDLPLNPGYRNVGPNATMDLRSIRQDWIADTVVHWARAAARHPHTLNAMKQAAKVADDVLTARGTRRSHLGLADMDAVVSGMRSTWPNAKTAKNKVKAFVSLIDYGRRCEELSHHWSEVPARFVYDPARHVIPRIDRNGRGSGDEPFRFVPQPIIDWLMDHLHLVDRGDDYRTAESRAMLYVHERTGRRTIETLRLKDDCLSYDDQGSPYLEWRKGKPPYNMGKRLPIHQETHDVIREWQSIKRDHGVDSQWLFPSSAYATSDRPYDTSYLVSRVSDLVRVVMEHAPYESAVEGAEGNLVYFDMTTMDPYSFRHAFAQRLADATDAEGRSTTPPDVLQDYMGHSNFNTTMIYYEVTAKRRKKALDALPARRINLLGQVETVNRERDGFTKVAVSLGHCKEPQNVAAGGHACALDHACESCPFFLVDPLERLGVEAKQQHLRVRMERARAIRAPQHMLDHYEARIKDCGTIIDGIDAFVDSLPETERDAHRVALEKIADIRRRATAPRFLNLRQLLRGVA